MSEKRPPKPDDQEQAEIAFRLLREFFTTNAVTEPNVMVSAMMSVIADNYYTNGISYNDYRQDMMYMADFYKRYWDDDE